LYGRVLDVEVVDVRGGEGVCVEELRCQFDLWRERVRGVP
jgi:hypothetical protein